MKPQSKNRFRPRFDVLEDRSLLSTTITSTILESEPNDRRATADVFSLVAVGESVELEGTVSKRDQDFFRFQGTSIGSVNISVTPGTKVQIESAQGVKLFESEPNNGVLSGTFAVTEGTTYFLRVRPQGDASLNYEVVLGTETGVAPAVAPSTPSAQITLPSATASSIVAESEPNDRKGQADSLVLGTGAAISLTGSVSKDDRDFFRFTATQSGTVNVSVSAGAKVQVEDARGNKMMETEPNNGVNSGSFSVTEGTTYFVRVRSASNATVRYQVDVTA
jgi:hypothetical protein